MPTGIEVLVEDGFATIDVAERALRGQALAALLENTPAELIEKQSRSGPRATYRVPEGNARAAGLIDAANTVDSLPDRKDLHFADELVAANSQTAPTGSGTPRSTPWTATPTPPAATPNAPHSRPLRPNKLVAAAPQRPAGQHPRPPSCRAPDRRSPPTRPTTRRRTPRAPTGRRRGRPPSRRWSPTRRSRQVPRPPSPAGTSRPGPQGPGQEGRGQDQGSQVVTDQASTTEYANLRETFYRLVSAVAIALFGVGVLTATEQALWVQLGIATVTLVFAVMYSTSNWRTALYLVTGPLAAVLGAYGLVQGVDWAVITTAVAEALGITTAAAKTVQTEYAPAA